MSTVNTSENLYFGFDLSTQSLTLTVIDDKLNPIQEESINFDTELPKYQTKGGAIRHKDGRITSPTLMWIDALDLLLERLKTSGFGFERVRAISASGQQHGSVYWKKGARQILDNLSPEKTLASQLSGAFSIDQSPIWMDSSTSKECREIESLMGGPNKVATLTGSKCFERFTVNQIAKIYRDNPVGYNSTERISLVSSFCISLFLHGQYASIDPSDGSGMNVMDLNTKTWIKEILDYAGPDLAEKLGKVNPSHTIQGTISKYFQERYGFSSKCSIVTAAGDNPCTLAGLKLELGNIAVSLGTSSTLFGPLVNPKPSADEGNIMCNPIDYYGYMGMICYKNGALAREHVRDLYAKKSWDAFSLFLRETPPGNNGNIGFYFEEQEIIPHIKGFYYFDATDTPIPAWEDGKIHARGIVESQALSMYIHAENIGLKVTNRILVTGGTSKNTEILQILSDVFGVPVYTGQQPNSASVGAAYRALHGVKCDRLDKFVPFAEVVGETSFILSATPNMENHKMYQTMSARYKKLEQIITKQISAGL